MELLIQRFDPSRDETRREQRYEITERPDWSVLDGLNHIKDEIEESGLFGGIAQRVKKSADSYVNQKLDEIEARIDRKLDEIDRRLAEWRDKEIANRIRILKITLWASVIVGAFSLIYSYVKVYFVDPTPRQGSAAAQIEPARRP